MHGHPETLVQQQLWIVQFERLCRAGVRLPVDPCVHDQLVHQAEVLRRLSELRRSSALLLRHGVESRLRRGAALPVGVPRPQHVTSPPGRAVPVPVALTRLARLLSVDEASSTPVPALPHHILPVSVARLPSLLACLYRPSLTH